ncbi:MAG: DUF2066 domain-containing protein, partial [Chromatiales bacterium]|nr:DUF2066 domain-containing protein [Chromatiales bacterium]
QYRYRLLETGGEVSPPPVAETAPGASAESSEAAAPVVEPPRMLQVIFDSAAVNRMLRDKGLPVWGSNRPGGLVWIGVEQKGKRRLLSPEAGLATINTSIEKGARQRGVSVLFPLMDLEDQASMQVADLWGDFESNIRRASQRYAPDLIVTGKLIQVARGHWRADWRLYHGAQVNSWQEQAGSVDMLAQSGIGRVADLLAERFAPVAVDTDMNRVRVRVDGVLDLQSYTSLARFLESQSAVDRVELIRVEADAVIYDLHTRGGTLALQQGLDLGGVLVEAAGGFSGRSDGIVDSQSESDVDLYYRLR